MAETEPKPVAPKKSRLRALITITVVLIGEAALIIGAMMILGGEPKSAKATDAMGDPVQTEDEKIVEILVLDGRLPNAKSGVTFLYETEVYAQVRKKHAPLVSGQLEQFSNEIKADITAIWRTAEPAHFKEPRLENLTRKVAALLNERFGNDAQTGEPILVKPVIVMGTGFRIDI